MNQIKPAFALAACLYAVSALAGTSGTFQVGERGHVLVPVSIDGEEERPFAVDTAASQVVLDSATYAPLLASADADAAPVAAHGAHGDAQATMARLQSIHLWTAEQRDQTGVLMRIADLTHGATPDFSGVLGVPFLARYRLDLDYPRRRIAFDEIAAGLPPCDICTPADRIEVIPLPGGLPSVSLNVNGRTIRAVLDTGAAASILNDAAVAALGLADFAAGEQLSAVDISFGIGPTRAHAVRRIPLPVFAALGLNAEPAMILGIDFIGSGRLVLDLSGRQAWFKAPAQ